MYFGWSCMSCRQADPLKTATTTINAAAFARKALRRATPKRGERRRERAEFAEKYLLLLSAVSASSAFNVVAALSIRNGRNLPRAERFEKAASSLEIELRVLCFDAQEEPVSAGQGEARHVEHRVIRHRQSVESEHSKDSRQRSGQDRAFKGHRDKRRPAVVRLPADIERKCNRRDPVLQRVAADA